MDMFEYIKNLEEKFQSSSIRKEDARELVAHVLLVLASKLNLEKDRVLTIEQAQLLKKLVEKRLSGVPLQYLLGECGFWNSVFRVGPGVLIPRPETEHLVELILENKEENFTVAELGAGSGNIGISVLQERKWEWHAFEINPDSVPFVSENRKNLLPKEAKYHLHEVDFFKGANDFAPYDAIVSNPPYIETEEIEKLSKEVQQEPWLALDGGKTGVELIEKLAEVSYPLLKPGGFLAIEIGFGQKEKVCSLFEKKGFQQIQVLKDLAGIERIIKGVKPWMH